MGVASDTERPSSIPSRRYHPYPLAIDSSIRSTVHAKTSLSSSPESAALSQTGLSEARAPSTNIHYANTMKTPQTGSYEERQHTMAYPAIGNRMYITPIRAQSASTSNTASTGSGSASSLSSALAPILDFHQTTYAHSPVPPHVQQYSDRECAPPIVEHPAVYDSRSMQFHDPRQVTDINYAYSTYTAPVPRAQLYSSSAPVSSGSRVYADRPDAWTVPSVSQPHNPPNAYGTRNPTGPSRADLDTYVLPGYSNASNGHLATCSTYGGAAAFEPPHAQLPPVPTPRHALFAPPPVDTATNHFSGFQSRRNAVAFPSDSGVHRFTSYPDTRYAVVPSGSVIIGSARSPPYAVDTHASQQRLFATHPLANPGAPGARSHGFNPQSFVHPLTTPGQSYDYYPFQRNHTI